MSILVRVRLGITKGNYTVNIIKFTRMFQQSILFIGWPRDQAKPGADETSKQEGKWTAESFLKLHPRAARRRA